MEEVLYQETKNNDTIEIYYDHSDNKSPRLNKFSLLWIQGRNYQNTFEWGHLISPVCDINNFESWEEQYKALCLEFPKRLFTPVYKYRENGKAFYNTTGFDGPNNCGLIGFIASAPVESNSDLTFIVEQLVKEVQDYSLWCNGEIFTVHCLNEQDGGWVTNGIYGYHNALTVAKALLNHESN